jgi:hypothetical protein
VTLGFTPLSNRDEIELRARGVVIGGALAQGFHLARPLPAGGVTELLGEAAARAADADCR